MSKRYPYAPGTVEHGSRQNLWRDLALAVVLMAASGALGFSVGMLRGCTQ